MSTRTPRARGRAAAYDGMPGPDLGPAVGLS